MPSLDTEAQFKFLLCCIKHSAAGKVNFGTVAEELGIVSKAAAAKRYERLLKAHDISTATPRKGAPAAAKDGNDDKDGEQDSDSKTGTPASKKRKRAAAPKKTPTKKAKDDDEEEADDDEETPVKKERGSRAVKKEKGVKKEKNIKKEESDDEDVKVVVKKEAKGADDGSFPRCCCYHLVTTVGGMGNDDGDCVIVGERPVLAVPVSAPVPVVYGHFHHDYSPPSTPHFGYTPAAVCHHSANTGLPPQTTTTSRTDSPLAYRRLQRLTPELGASLMALRHLAGLTTGAIILCSEAQKNR